jgi:hypothetical protein
MRQPDAVLMASVLSQGLRSRPGQLVDSLVGAVGRAELASLAIWSELLDLDAAAGAEPKQHSRQDVELSPGGPLAEDVDAEAVGASVRSSDPDSWDPCEAVRRRRPLQLCDHRRGDLLLIHLPERY